MSQIHFEPNRQGMTVLPDDIDDATGERIEGTSKVIDTRVANWAHNEQDSEDPDDLAYEDPDAVEEPLPPLEVRLSDTFDEVYNTDYEVSDEMANSIASQDIGDTPEATTVKFLAMKVFQGEMTPEESFQAAVESGLNPDKLLFSYYQLKSKFE